MNPCGKEHPPEKIPPSGKAWDATTMCRPCYKIVNGHRPPPEKVQESRGKRTPLKCVHRGELTGEEIKCPTCRGHVMLKVYSCDIHGKCILGKTREGVQGCDEPCPDKWLTDLPDFPVAKAILLTGGIGDAFTLEGMMTDDQRKTLETIYYACPAAKEISEVFQKFHNFPNLRSHIILPTHARTHYSQGSVEKMIGYKLPEEVQDWSIGVIFPQHRKYVVSSLLTNKFADVEVPNNPYVIIAPASSWGKWKDRNFSAQDWKQTIAFLEQHDLYGAVLMREVMSIPKHPRLLDYQGKTNILESVELLKAAQGYIGVDTCWSVPATKLFPVQRLRVKTVSPHCKRWKHLYFAPLKDFSFLRDRITGPSWN